MNVCFRLNSVEKVDLPERVETFFQFVFPPGILIQALSLRDSILSVPRNKIQQAAFFNRIDYINDVYGTPVIPRKRTFVWVFLQRRNGQVADYPLVYVDF